MFVKLECNLKENRELQNEQKFEAILLESEGEEKLNSPLIFEF